MFDEDRYKGRIHHVIREYIHKNKDGGLKLAIYPFGSVGQLTKRILNEAYGIVVDYIIDEKLSTYNSEINSLERFLGTKESANIAVIIASDSLDDYDEIRTKSEAVFRKENIFDLFGRVCQVRDTSRL